jgi:hypothetical protein
MIGLETKTEREDLSHYPHQIKRSEWPKCEEMEPITVDIVMRAIDLGSSSLA